jgi:hypothetical protein
VVEALRNESVFILTALPALLVACSFSFIDPAVKNCRLPIHDSSRRRIRKENLLHIKQPGKIFSGNATGTPGPLLRRPGLFWGGSSVFSAESRTVDA